MQDRHRYTFYLRTPGRTYYLAADSEEEMNKWIECLCQVCGLKVIEDDSEGIGMRVLIEVNNKLCFSNFNKQFILIF